MPSDWRLTEEQSLKYKLPEYKCKPNPQFNANGPYMEHVYGYKVCMICGYYMEEELNAEEHS